MIESINQLNNSPIIKQNSPISFKGKKVPLKQLTDNGLTLASSAIGAVGLAGVALNNSLKSPDEIENALQGLTKQQIDLCTNPDGEISLSAIELVKRLLKNEVTEEVTNRLMLSCRNDEGDWRNHKYTTISEEAVSLAYKMLDYNYSADMIHCTLSNANCSSLHDSEQLLALSKYIETYPETDIDIECLALTIRGENTYFLNKALELKNDNKISLSETELKDLMRFINEVPESSNYIIEMLEKRYQPSKIFDKFSYFQILQRHESFVPAGAKEVLLSAISNEKFFQNNNLIMALTKYLSRPYESKPNEQYLTMIQSMIKDENFSLIQLQDILNFINNTSYIDGEEISKSYKEDIIRELYFDKEVPNELLRVNFIKNQLSTKSKEEVINNIKNLISKNSEAIQKAENAKQKMLEHPELYVNGELDSIADKKNNITDWFYEKYIIILKTFEALDKESIDYLMRLRLNKAEEYIYTVSRFIYIEIELLKNLIKSHDINGETFKPKQKIEMIDLLEAYYENDLSSKIITDMIQEDKVDLEKLQFNLFYKIMLNAGMSREEILKIPKEKLMTWDTKYSHLLSKEINDSYDDSFADIIKAANLDDFVRYIHDTSNQYGGVNKTTRNRFNQLGMNYEKWLNPSKANEVQFVAVDENMEQLNNLAQQIAENMNVLIQSPAKSFVIKQFGMFIKDNKFVLPEEYSSNKTKLKELLQNLTNETEQGQLYQVWKRAKDNSTCGNSEKETRAKGTLTVLDHLKQKLSDIDKIKMDNGSKNLSLTIKMWDRIPQKDLFQGNYSSCCIGIGHSKGRYMPHYLMNTAFNMIELLDDSGNVIGNALCYFVTESNSKPAFIIDNIEINDAEMPSKEVQKQLRDAITKYADNVAKEVTGRDDISIYMSDNWNDVFTGDLPKSRDTVSFVGDIDCNYIYLDLYHNGNSEEVTRNGLTRKNSLFKLK